MMGASSYIAVFYNKPILQPMLMFISVTFVIASFGIIQKTIFIRNMDFKIIALVELIAVIVAGIFGIYFAYTGHGVWCLVYQLVIFTFVNTCVLWICSKWRPKFIFSILAIQDILNFSVNMLGFNIVNYFSRNIDYLIIGKFLGAEALGFYTLAYKLMLYPLQNISWIISKVMFPAFSRMQHDLEKVRNAYLKMIKAISLITFPMMMGLFAVAPEFVNVMFGPKWQPIVVLVRIFCVCGMFQSIGTTVGIIYQSQGRPDILFKLQFLGTFIVATSVLIGLKWGILGVACCYTIQAMFWIIFNFIIVFKLIRLGKKTFYSKLLKALTNCLIMLILILLFKSLLLVALPVKLCLSVIFGIVLYFSLLLASKEIVLKNKHLIFLFLK